MSSESSNHLNQTPLGCHLTTQTMQAMVNEAMDYAKKKGASDCACQLSESAGLQVNVRQKEVDTLEHMHNRSLEITVYLGKRKGHASSSDLTREASFSMVDAALDIAKNTSEDDFSGLPDADLVATSWTDLSLYHPWDIATEDAITLAKCCEEAALATDQAITNSEGAGVSVHHGQFYYAHTHGFSGGFQNSIHSISCMPIAKRCEEMQRDYWYSEHRDPEELQDARHIGQKSAERSIARLGSKKIKTIKAPVIFDATVASSLIKTFVSAASGGNLYRRASFLQDSIEKKIFSDQIKIIENPLLLKGIASNAFDGEGVETAPREVVTNGVLNGYFLSSYSARKLGMQTTANAGGAHNLIVQSGTHSLDEIIRGLDQAFLVTEMMGSSISLMTGDYSRGASGFWIEKGEIIHPVHGMTIAGNLKEMFLDIDEVANDTLIRGRIASPSLLVQRMTIAGD